MFDFFSDHPSFCSLYRHHDTTNFFYRPQSPQVMTDNDDSVALRQRCRTNLRNAELSKHTFRIFLEKQILSHVEIEVRKNIPEAQTPLTPNFDSDEINFTLSRARLALVPLQTVSRKESSNKDDLSLPNLETEICSDRAMKTASTIMNYSADSEINKDSFQNKSKISTCTASNFNQNASNLKINPVNEKSNCPPICDDGPEWFQDNETVSVHGSLLSETISDISAYSTDLKRNTNHKRCRWRRILFCCVN